MGNEGPKVVGHTGIHKFRGQGQQAGHFAPVAGIDFVRIFRFPESLYGVLVVRDIIMLQLWL
jgi:hypothetical protein